MDLNNYILTGITGVDDPILGIRFFTGTATPREERMRISEIGNVGIGITGTTGPVAKFQVNTDSNSELQYDTNGILLSNSSLATGTTNSISPAIVLQGAGWKTNGTAGSQDVRFRIDMLPEIGNSAPGGSLRIATSVNGTAYAIQYTLSDGGVFTNTGAVQSPVISAVTQLTSLGDYGADFYRLRYNDSDINPSIMVGSKANQGSGSLAYGIDGLNGISFLAANDDSPNIHIARAGINITNLTDTLSNESADLAFFTQNTGSAMTEKMRISKDGYVGIGTTGPTAKLQVNHDMFNVFQDDSHGILLSNATPADMEADSASPPIVLQGNGWAQFLSTSQDVRFRFYTLPKSDYLNPTGQLKLQSSINGDAYTDIVNFNSDGSAEFTYYVTSTQIQSSGGISSATQIQSIGLPYYAFDYYRVRRSGSDIYPKAIFGATYATPGDIRISFDAINGIVLSGAAEGYYIARAAIDIVNLGNTANSESADLAFFTQSGGATMAERMRIKSDGNVGIGITGTTGPVSKLQINTAIGSTTQSDANGLFLSNPTSATGATTATLSPPIVLQGSAFKSGITAASHDVRFRIDTLPITGVSTTTGQLRFASSINGAAYGNTVSIDSSGQIRTGTAGTVNVGDAVIISASQISHLNNSVGNGTYRMINNGSESTPRLMIGISGTPGTAISIGPTHQLVFSYGNTAGQNIARAGLQIANIGNTAGSESADLIFLTQSAGATMAERVRINSLGYVGIGQTGPTAKLQINTNQNSVTQNDANGILLANSTAATNGTQSISPPLVIQGNGFQTTTNGSQDVRFRMEVLPVQSSGANPTGQFRLSSSVNSGIYANALTYTTGGILECYAVSGSQMILAQSQLVSSPLNPNFFAAGTFNYSTRNSGGTTVTPRIFLGDSTGTSSGAKTYGIDPTNGIVFIAGNSSGNRVARASIDLSTSSNSAGNEMGSIIFRTQNSGADMATRLTIGPDRITSSVGFISNTQLIQSSSNVFQLDYNYITGGINVIPSVIAATNSNTAGDRGISLDTTNGLVFMQVPTGGSIRRTSYASINGVPTGNTASSESGDLAFSTQSGGATMSVKMTISGTGNVGIGQTAPTAKLHINSNVRSETQANNNGVLLANTSAAATGGQSISPPMLFQGNGWSTVSSASQSVRFRLDVLPVQGATNPTGNLRVMSAVNSDTFSSALTISSTGDVTFANGGNIVISEGTGTKIGTAAAQPIGFWNATPIQQPTTSTTGATYVSPGGGTNLKTDDTFDGYTVAQVVRALRNMGLLE